MDNIDNNDDLVDIHEAAAILSRKRGRPVSPDYLRSLRFRGLLQAVNEGGRHLRFRRESIEALGADIDDSDLVDIHEAATILSAKYNREISPDYIRQLRRQGKLKEVNPGEYYLRFRRDAVEAVKIGAPRNRRKQ